MKIAIIGAGRIGTAFAYRLARANHDVTMVARGKRLEELKQNPAIQPVTGPPASVKVAASLDAATPWDLVLVTVLANQVDGVLPTLTASAAKTILFMFNTFEATARLRNAVGAHRAAFGFPTVTSFFVDGKLKSSMSGAGQNVALDNAAWAKIFSDAEIATVLEPDMDSFLRSHVAMIIPLMCIGNLAYQRRSGISYAESQQYVDATREAFAAVHQLGHKVIPRAVSAMDHMPSFLLRCMFWAVSRTQPVRALGEFGSGEAQSLIDAVVAASPGPTAALKEIRPR